MLFKVMPPFFIYARYLALGFLISHVEPTDAPLHLYSSLPVLFTLSRFFSLCDQSNHFCGGNVLRSTAHTLTLACPPATPVKPAVRTDSTR